MTDLDCRCSADHPEPRKHPILAALLVLVLGVLLVAVTVNQTAAALKTLGFITSP